MEIVKGLSPRCSSCFKPYVAMRLRGILYYACKQCGSTLIDFKDLSENFPNLFPANKPLNYMGSDGKKCPACGENTRPVLIGKTMSAFSCVCGKMSCEKGALEAWFDIKDAGPARPRFKLRMNFLLSCAGAAGIFFTAQYLTESALQAATVTGIFGIPALLLIRWTVKSDIPDFYEPEESKKNGFVHVWETSAAILRELLMNWPRVIGTVLILAFLWFSTKGMRAQTLKDIAIMIQPENQTKEASEAPGFFDRLGLMCDFSIAAYRTDPKVLQDWEIKAIRGICEASGDPKRWEKMNRYLPPPVEEDNPEDYDIRGSAAQAQESDKT